jgi:hypothetical protein
MSGGFLSRWSRLKRGEPPAAVSPPPGEAPPAGPELAPEELEARLAELPAIDEIGPATDVTKFFADWVPKALRDAALRKAWASDPRIAGFVEVADFQWNWNVPGGAPGCGPLEPGFDAVAHIEQLFARAHAPFASGPEADVRDLASHVPQPRTDAAPQHEERAEGARPGAAGEEESSSPAESRVSPELAADVGVVAAQQAEPPPAAPRRRAHGGALPT